MAFVVKDRVRETSTTTGTGTIVLAGAVQGFQSFSVIGDTNTTFYCIANTQSGEWEVGVGTYLSATTSLSRDTVLESSNAGSLVNFSSGEKDVFVTYPAEKAIYTNPSNETILGNLSVSANQITSTEASDDILLTPTGIGALKVQNRITLEDTLSFGPVDPQGSYFANNAEYLQTGPLSAWQYLQNGTATKVEFDNGAAMAISNAASGNQGDLILGWTEVLNISSAGDVVTGNWTAGIIDSAYGGTGVNNGGNLLNITANASISGSNTGDQIITLTGDVTGSGTGSFAATLANTTVTAGTYGSATQVPQFTVNSKGQLTGVSNLSVDDSTKLLLAGGTMTGNIAFAASQPWPTFNQNTTGNAATATALQTSRNINGVAFDGTDNITLTANTTQALTINGPLTGGSFNGGTATSLGIQTANGTQAGALSSTDWTTFNNKQAAISLTTTGSSGAATFVSNTLNVPDYTLLGLGGISASSTDTLTNKTLTDSTTFLQDDADNTKKAQFQLSSIATATTRTFTLPNVDGTLVTTGDTGSVTNAMLAGSIADSKLSTISTAGKVSNSATTATNANTASAIVARDASGNFSAGTITANLTGLASTATMLTAGNANLYTNTLPGNTGGSATYIYVGRWTTTQTLEKLSLKILYNNSAASQESRRTSEYNFYLFSSDGTQFTTGSTGNFYAWGRGLFMGEGGALNNSDTRIVQISNTQYDIYINVNSGVSAGNGSYLINISGGSWAHSGTDFGTTAPTGNTLILYSDAILTDYTYATFYAIGVLATIGAQSDWSNAAILMNGDIGSRIEWTDVGSAAPATTTRSVGTKLVLRPQITASTVDMAIGANGDNMWLSVLNSTGNVNMYAGSSLVSSLTGAGGFTGTGQITTTRANNTANGGGQIFLNGATGNRIDFNTNGVGAPAFTTRGAGTKIVLSPQVGAAAVDYALGLESGTLWFSVPTASNEFKHYGGTTVLSRLADDGVSNRGVVYQGNSAITTQNTGTTLTIAQILTLVILSTPTANITFTLPTGTNVDAGVIANLETNRSFTWSITNTALSFTITMAAAVGHTYFGNTTIAANTSASFRTVKTAANTFTTYRI